MNTTWLAAGARPVSSAVMVSHGSGVRCVSGNAAASVNAFSFSLIRARFPDIGTDFQLQGSDKPNKLLKVLSSQVSNWDHLSQVEMALETQWGESFLRLKSISSANGTWIDHTTIQIEDANGPQEVFDACNCHFGAWDSP